MLTYAYLVLSYADLCAYLAEVSPNDRFSGFVTGMGLLKFEYWSKFEVKFESNCTTRLA
jgi:hypothetical protein